MKRINILYWIFTGLVAFMLGFGAIFDVMMVPEAMDHITHLGYPDYIVPFLGVAKMLGVIAILVPGFPRIKEWAYAGLTYDIMGALYSHISFGEGIAMWGGLIVGLALIATSYILYHKRLAYQVATAAAHK